MSLLRWAVSTAVLVQSTFCAVQNYQFDLTNPILAPDGVSRSTVAVNGQVPGTLITAKKNDTIKINVVNNLNDTSMAQGTSIHWHGLLQDKTASQDGVAWVTQCPIAANDTFQYTLNVGEQTGTYWYHSHLTTQYCDGLVGPIVIYDDEDPLRHLYDVDDESTVITLGDWFHLPSPQAYALLENPDSTLINGRGRFAGGPEAPLSVINFAPGLRYRLRLVGTGCIAAFNFSIDGHTLTVIETDGTETVPTQTDIVSIWPGQRMSVVVQANQPVDNYWIRAVPFVLGVTPSNETGVNAAILRYKGAPNEEPTTNSTGSTRVDDKDLASLASADLRGQEPDVSFTFNITLDESQTHFLMNGNLYVPPPIPVLLQILNGSANAHDLMPVGSVITFPRNSLISVTIPGGSPFAPHPFHLHGHKFQITRSASSATDNLTPLYRDVLNTGYGDSDTTFLFQTDNPGPWLLHCHIDFHLEASLAIVFAEAPEDQISGPDAVETPKDWEALCPNWNSLTTGKQFSVDETIGTVDPYAGQNYTATTASSIAAATSSSVAVVTTSTATTANSTTA